MNLEKEFKLFGEFAKDVKYEMEVVSLVTIQHTIFVINKNNSVYFPGGVIEKGEKDIDALNRELKEELNLNLEKVSKEFIKTYVFSPKKKCNILVKTYIGKISGEIKIKEDELEGVIIYPYKRINYNFLKWLNQRFLLGPSVIDVFLIKKDELEKILKNFNPF